MAQFANHTLAYAIKTACENSEDISLSFEKYVSYAYFGQEFSDLGPDEIQHARREYEEAMQQLRGDE